MTKARSVVLQASQSKHLDRKSLGMGEVQSEAITINGVEEPKRNTGSAERHHLFFFFPCGGQKYPATHKKFLFFFPFRLKVVAARKNYMAHHFIKTEDKTDEGTPLLYCQACGCFSNQPGAKQKCSVNTSDAQPILSSIEKTCYRKGCSNPVARTCRSTVAGQTHCGNDFCDDHAKFIQSVGGDRSGYQCSRCAQRSEEHEIDTELQQMRLFCCICCPCLCGCFWPKSVLRRCLCK